MSVFRSSQEALESLEVNSIDTEERLTKPSALRVLHRRFCQDDAESSANRAAVQELMDFVPPYDQNDLETRGMQERFNINYGSASALKNEAVGPFLDIFTSPSSLVKIALDQEVDPDLRSTYADVMSDEWTKMIRSWDVMTSNILQLVDADVTHGVAIPWFEDKATLNHEIGTLEDCKFDADAVAVPSRIEAMTIERSMSVPELFAKIEGEEGNTDYDGWNGPEAKRLIESAKPKQVDAADWNYEEAARMVKACRSGNPHALPAIELVWGVIRELDGQISVYATTKDGLADTGDQQFTEKEDTTWLYRKRGAYDDANQMFQIFTFSVGNKNRIYTIRGFGYALFEPGTADNILRCKMMDSARHRASEIYQPESTVDSLEDTQFIDFGHYMLAPKGLRGVPQNNTMRMDENIGFVLDSNQQVMNQHGAGLASNSIIQNPTARRNEMQVTAELEHTNKMQGFAISLFYGPYDKYMRELVRRSFTETQKDLAINKMVARMKEACVNRGVPLDVLSRIDLEATQATRLQGAGSKGSRLIGFQQMGQLYAEMDPQGKEYFNYDFASEIKGSEAAERYFGKPGQRRGHVDVALARLENADMLEGTLIEPVDGENKMIHLQEHIESLITGIEEVNEGVVEIADWTMRYIPTYQHCVATLEQTTVHESRIQELNSYRQQVQQAGELIDNGLRHINKMREGQGDMSQGLDPNGNPVPGVEAPMTPEQQKASASQQDNDLKMAKIFAEAQAKIAVMQQMSQAKQAIMHEESTARILTMDAQTSADIRRKEILAKASLGS
jgi:hypothetical protein